MAAPPRKKRPYVPLAPLLATITAEHVENEETSHDLTRFRQTLRAIREVWFNEPFLDAAPAEELAERVVAFASHHVPTFAHTDLVGRSPALLRHGLTHLLRGADDVWQRFARCADASGPYFIPGLGRRFWGCLLPAVAPNWLPTWLLETESGMRRTGVIGSYIPRRSVAALERACLVYEELLRDHPGLSAGHLDALFMGVAGMAGRELVPMTVETLHRSSRERIAKAVRSVRTRQPLRKRLANGGEQFQQRRTRLLDAIQTDDDVAAAAVLREIAAGVGQVRSDYDRCSAGMIGELYHAAATTRELPEAFQSAVAALGIGPAVAALHLTDPAVFPPLVRAAAAFDDALADGLSPADEYRVLMSLLRHFRSHHRVHPFEFADVVAALADDHGPDTPAGSGSFNGFCTDTFRFFADLTAENSRTWMEAARPRYQFAVREPLVELCTALADRYVTPVLAGEYGWDVECDPRPGKALTSICKNDYGRSAPYQPTLWLTFYPRSAGSRRQAAQFFVRADADGLRYGFHLGPHARAAGRRFRQNVQHHAGPLVRALAATDAPDAVTFAADDTLSARCPLRSPEDLRAWATGKTLAAGRFRPAADPMLRGEELVGEIMLTFDRLVPLFAAAVENDPLPVLSRRAGSPGAPADYDAAAFARDTFLSDVWLDRTLGLLKLKRQLILQGLPGTGKTHVARCLARLLTRDRPDGIRVVQFHPGYGYAEFVEGSAGAEGRDGVLCQFAAQAAVRPAEAFVLVIDELTRGHLPTVFGELFYLLEYRGQTVTLPYSRRPFRLPENLYLIGTANTAERAAALDQALRRRFAFVELGPDPAVLAKWLDAHPPADPDLAFGPRVVRLFEQLNVRVARDFGPDRQFGHSLFMVPDLDAGKLRAVWDHHVLPTVAALAADRPTAGYDLARLFVGEPDAPRPAVPVVS